MTADQQKQVFDATGKTYTELTFDLSQTGALTEKALGAVVGGEDISHRIPSEES